MTRSIFFSNVLFILAGSLLFMSACSDDHNDDHFSPIGVVLKVDGELLAAQEENTVTYATGDAITITAGTTTETITLEFLDDDGSHFTPGSNGNSLQLSIGNPDILGFTHPVNDDEWSFRLNGEQPGSTTLQFELWHDGHTDFTSREFQVIIEEPQSD